MGRIAATTAWATISSAGASSSPVSDLEATLPTVGDAFTETVVLERLPGDATVCGGWDPPDYTFTYRTTRLPDVRTDFRSELLAAMERSAIPVASDAVAAGLRLLMAPAARQAEAEPAARPPGSDPGAGDGPLPQAAALSFL